MKKNSRLIGLLLLYSLFPFTGNCQLFWNINGTSNTWTASNWGTSSSGPFTTAWTNNSATEFTASSLITYVTSTPVGNITVSGSSTTVTFTSAGTLTTSGNIRTIDVASNCILDFNGQDVSTAGGTGFIKNGSGTWNLSGQSNLYPGGFTLNAGTVIVSAKNSFGSGAMTINGGNIQSSTNLTYGISGLTLGGDFTFSGTGVDSFNIAVGIGSSTRTITNSTTSGSRKFTGIISGSGGLTIAGSGSGTIILTGTNTYSGLTTVTGTTLQLNKSGGGTLPSSNNMTVNGGTLQISSNQTLNAFTLTSGTIIIDNGITLTINGNFSKNIGTTITLTGSGSIQYGGSSTLVYDGSSTQTPSVSEFPSSGGPNNLTINNSAGVTFPGSFSRTISGTLTFTSGKLTLGSSNLILASGATITGASSANYIVTNSTGYLQRNAVTSSTDFPVGNSTYNPLNIVNSGTSDNFRVSVADDVLDAGTSGSALTTNAVDRTWTVAEETGGGSNVTLTTQWNASDELGSFSRSSCYLSHYNGGWDATTAGAASGSDPYTISRSGITTFSPFGVGSGGALPVTLINFKATKINETALITWVTATELNNDYFSIERKTPYSEYELIGTVKGAGNSNEMLHYSFTDKFPIVNTLNYYRIVQHDFNGNEEIFGPVSMRLIHAISEVSILPNPFKNIISINWDVELNTNKIKVINIIGKPIFEQYIEENTPITINTETWESGIYFITISGSGFIKTGRQIKF